MSKRNKRAVERPQEQKNTRGSALDTFVNAISRLGAVGSANFMSESAYPITRLSQNYSLCNSLYRNNWIFKKIINTIPDDCIKNWFSLTCEITPEQQDRYDKLERRTKIKEKLAEGLYWGRLYGGAGGLIMIQGDEDKLTEPLVVEDILPNTFKGLLILDRWSGIYPSVEIIEDIDDPDFGLPLYYEVRDETTEKLMEKVHHTRIIRFDGRKLPFWESLNTIMWGASEVEHLYEEIVKRDNTSWNIAGLVFQSNVLVNTVAGLDQLLAIGDPQMQQDFYNVKQAQNTLRSNSSMMVVGEHDDVKALNYTFTGLNEISESQMMDISGACDIPVSRLFGRSPAGMNATGEGDLQNYYDMIAQQQNTVLRPKIDKLLPIMFMSEFGKIPSDLGHRYNPVRTPSDEQVANLVKNKSDSIINAYKENLLTQRAAVTELHTLSLTTSMFAAISDENIEAADDTYSNMGDLPSIDFSSLGGEQSSDKEKHRQEPLKMDEEEYMKRYGHSKEPVADSKPGFWRRLVS